jgi:hypothetical protein
MCKFCRSSERLFYWRKPGSHPLMRNKSNMPRSFTRSNSRFPRVVGTKLFMFLLLTLSLSTALCGQGPALTTIAEVRYTDAGWGADNNRNLVGRFTSSSFSLTRYARSQNYFLRSYDSSMPPKYSRYSAALHVDYPL